MSGETRCCVYEFRITATNLSHTELISYFKGIVKKYAFQKEKGEENGYLHYQGRLSFIKKVRKSNALRIFPDELKQIMLKDGYWLCPTITKEYLKGEGFYHLKEQTRVAGPYKDTDVVRYIPRQIRECPKLRPFQQTIVDDCDNWDTRTINVVYEPLGNRGKTILVGYCRAYNIGRALPMVNDYKDLLRMVCDLPTSRMYLFDMPRSIKKDRLFQFFSAVETIKDGYAYDDRYSFKEKNFDSPNIWIFTNTLPDTSMLSLDRWKIWKITKNYKLKRA